MSKNHDWNQRRALGKGLSTLLPNKPTVLPPPLPPQPAPTPAAKPLPEHFEDFESLPLEQIVPGPEQPRSIFDEERLAELAHSIKTNGLLQPITVQKHPDGKYRIIAGERRWRAAKLAGLDAIPALIRTVEDSQRLELALIENIQREDLNALEIAAAFERLSTEHHLSHEQIADRTGKDRSTVTNLLRLLRLSDEVKEALRHNQISMGHARALLNVQDPALQADTCEMIIKDNLSVRETEAFIKQLSQTKEPKEPKPEATPENVDPNIRAALDEMAMALGTKIRLKRRRLEIEYYSQEDLDRIYSVIVRQ